jgi:hypothetical protein
MKKTSKAAPRRARDEMRAEYEFNYRQGKPNRFASGMAGGVVAVVLEPDVARVFDTSESVNRLLRSVIAAIPVREPGTSRRKPRRRAG